MHGDEIWDEDEWEFYLRQNERRIDRYMELLQSFLQDNPRPSTSDAAAFAHWKNDLRAFIDEKGWREEDLPSFLFADYEDEVDELDDWSFEFDASTADLEEDELDSFRQLPVYQQAFELASRGVFVDEACFVSRGADGL